jgi:hypothetical protein
MLMLWLQVPQMSATTLWQTTWDTTAKARRSGRRSVGLGWSHLMDILYMASVVYDTCGFLAILLLYS